MRKSTKREKIILLVEDDDIILNLMSRKLEQAGYQVEMAKDGVAGLSQIRKIQPDLVVLDILLPKLNGFGVLENLYKNKILPKLPIIIISNSGQPVEIDRALKLGARDYLIKVNFDPDEILRKIKNALSSQTTETIKMSGMEKDKKFIAANILIVEDEQILVELLERKFGQRGYKIFKAVDVEQARNILKDNKVDLILLDIVLPGMDGFTFLSELKSDKTFNSIPVIIISNLGQDEEIKKGLGLGAEDFLVKALVSPDEIVNKVSSFIKRSKLIIK